MELLKVYDMIIHYHLGKPNMVEEILSRKTISKCSLSFFGGV